ncbi:MAG TPA: TlpA family protein disulfide reductase [Gammaproteobacteria bacterium]|nr:TlpA family protein disulfide reductase [Gammaproteobacteria bacterium]
MNMRRLIMRQRRVLIRLVCMFALMSPMPGLLAGPLMAPIKEPFAAPDFVLTGEDGRTYRLSDYRGKVVVLNFWATWCPPCRFEMPAMERAWKKLRGSGVVILAINVGEDEDAIFEFFGNTPVTFPIPMDRRGEVVKAFHVTGLPTTYLVDPAGIVTHRAMGTREWDDAAMLAWLRGRLKVHPMQDGRPHTAIHIPLAEYQ